MGFQKQNKSLKYSGFFFHSKITNFHKHIRSKFSPIGEITKKKCYAKCFCLTLNYSIRREKTPNL